MPEVSLATTLVVGKPRPRIHGALQERLSWLRGLPDARISTGLSKLRAVTLPSILVEGETQMSYRSWRYPGTGQPYGYQPMTGPYPWMWPPSPYGYPPYQPAQTPEAEMEMLEQIREQLKGEREAINKEIEGINARIEELKKMIEEGTPQQSAPPIGQMPFWGPRQYGPMPAPYPPMQAPEQEKQMLEQQAKALEGQIEAIRKRLDELRRGE